MKTCRQVGKRIPDLASLPPVSLPAEIARHLAACPACRRALAAATQATLADHGRAAFTTNL